MKSDRTVATDSATNNARRGARRNLRSKSMVSVSTFSNNLRSFLQQLFTDNNNNQSEYNKRVLFLFYGISGYRGKNHMDQKDDDQFYYHIFKAFSKIM